MPDLTSAVWIELITLVVSMYSLVLFLTVEMVTVGRPWKMPVSSRLPVIFSAIICRSDGTEFVGHQLHALGVAVVDLAVKAHDRGGQVLAGRQGQGAGGKGQDERGALDSCACMVFSPTKRSMRR